MLWFFHPKPPSRKEVAMQVVERKTATVVDTRVIVVDQSHDHVPRMQEGENIDTHKSSPLK